jgi:hypothetical protein
MGEHEENETTIPTDPELREKKASRSKDEIEIEKLRLEVSELRAWRQKWLSSLLISFLGPIGAAIAFIAGLHISQSNERKTSTDTQFSQSMQLASNSDPSMRMAGIMALGRFVAPEQMGWDVLGDSDESRHRQSQGVAFLVAKLSTEKDSDVLPLLGQALLHADRPVELPLLLTANRRFAEEYARFSGEYSALSVLRLLNRTHADQEDSKVGAARSEALRSLDHSLLREAVPLGNPASLNNKFLSNPFWRQGQYPFRSWFKEAERQGLSSDNPSELNSRTRPPGSLEIKGAQDEAMKAAFNLMKTSILLAGIANQDRSWIASLPRLSLRGNAIVIGQIDKEVADELEAKGAYVQRDESDVSSDPF